MKYKKFITSYRSEISSCLIVSSSFGSSSFFVFLLRRAGPSPSESEDTGRLGFGREDLDEADEPLLLPPVDL